MNLKIAVVSMSLRVIYESPYKHNNVVMWDRETKDLWIRIYTDVATSVALYSLLQRDQGEPLLPRNVFPDLLDKILQVFGVNQYCIGCGEWFNDLEMTRGDGNDESGYDWYCNVCEVLYSPENPPWDGLKGVNFTKVKNDTNKERP